MTARLPFAAVLPLGLASVVWGSAAPPSQEYARVIFGTDTVVAEVASTPQDRERGLMFREELADGAGMLFVFEDEAIRGFWMHNTHIDLDIALLDSELEIIEVQQRTAMDREVIDSEAPFAYAVEVPRGWFERRDIGVGDTARIEFDDPPQFEAASTPASAWMSDSSL